MRYSCEDVQAFVQEEDVRFIHLAFCDVFGRRKNIAILPMELDRAFRYGIAIDASAIAGFGGAVHSDLFLHPIPDSLTLLPWRPEQGKLVELRCFVTYPDGRRFENDTRSILLDAVARAERAGLRFSFGSELEFYLFCLNDEGEPTDRPYDRASYMDTAPEDKGEGIRREICMFLQALNIQPEGAHHEEGPGQNEIDFRYSDALTAADNAMTFRAVVKTVAARNGLFADFSPRPLADAPGSGFHINMSVRADSGEDLLPHMIAGILEYVPDVTVFLNPTEASYARLGRDKAPQYVSWSSENRSQLVRVPAAAGEFRRAELRSPDPGANPYLAFALLIHAAMDGMEAGLALPPAADVNFFTADARVLEQYQRLPSDREEAARIAAGSDFVRRHLPQMLIDAYCAG
ncbi:MAG: glutamine synthetase [Oscillospiraceae bacterium]|nr:glutamine synthetase [Oscillospiraceae bacterium]